METTLSREEKVQIIQESLITTNEAAEILGATYSRIRHLIAKGKIAPVIKNGTSTFLLRDDIENGEFSDESVMAIFPDGTKIETSSRSELEKILKEKFDISPALVKNILKSGKPFEPYLFKHAKLAGLTIKSVETE
ncbi:helix-turn-helix domain-containing protein [Cytobacillus praedii]|uniref:helix-turn-helix domain-containing protein n=1 Tax=Cytobacillus praedii TaxID=1742358 RepID=UPI002E204693|nr:helix-turn-helix domain-containing protein [Cytobacillus praedii]